MAFIKLGSILHPKEWPKESRFLDLRTLGWSLRNVSYNLKRACKAFDVEGKVDHKPTGKISSEEIEYCRGDVAATNRLLNAMMGEFDQHPIDLHPDKSYSPASIAKAYLSEMRIRQPKEHFKVPNKTLGIAMQSYFGGRAECRIRKIPVPVIHTDFTSQYPSVNALLGNWEVLTSSSIRFVDCTGTVKKLLSTVTLEDAFDQSFWKKLSFFALVKPKDDILPVRTMYNGKTQNIGLNYLTSEKPIWYQVAMFPTGRQDKVIPDSFRIILNQYLKKPEVKSLAPDGTPCIETTRGLLGRTRIVAGRLIPVGKETDRRWEQGDDPSMIDSDIYVFEKQTKLVVADPSERKSWRAIGLRRLSRESKLSTVPVSNALKGIPVRFRTLSIIRQTADRLSS